MLALWNLMLGKCSVMEKCTVCMGQKQMYLILCGVCFCPMAVIFLLIFIFKLSPTNGQVWWWHDGWPIGPQSLCGWRYLIFYDQYLIYTRIFSFTRWHSICMFARLNTCVGPSKERAAFGERKREFFLFIYLGLALDRGWYKVQIWHDCRVQWGPL